MASYEALALETGIVKTVRFASIATGPLYSGYILNICIGTPFDLYYRRIDGSAVHDEWLSCLVLSAESCASRFPPALVQLQPTKWLDDCHVGTRYQPSPPASFSSSGCTYSSFGFGWIAPQPLSISSFSRVKNEAAQPFSSEFARTLAGVTLPGSVLPLFLSIL